MEAATQQAQAGPDGPGAAGAETSAADRDLAVRLGSLMFLLMSTDRGATLRAIDESGLGLIQAKALFTVASMPEECDSWSVKGVADRLGVSLPSASRAIDGLVKQKLVTRTEDPDDRRVRRVVLTDAGRDLSDGFLSLRLQGLEQFAATLGEDERAALESAFDLLMKRPEVARVYRANRNRAGR